MVEIMLSRDFVTKDVFVYHWWMVSTSVLNKWAVIFIHCFATNFLSERLDHRVRDVFEIVLDYRQVLYDGVLLLASTKYVVNCCEESFFNVRLRVLWWTHIFHHGSEIFFLVIIIALMRISAGWDWSVSNVHIIIRVFLDNKFLFVHIEIVHKFVCLLIHLLYFKQILVNKIKNLYFD